MLLLGAIPLVSLSARADETQWYPVQGDDGAPIQNFRIPPELDPASVPGVVWKGPQTADAVIYEFFDYNCAYCKKAARDVDAVVAKDSKLRLGLVNNPILSLGSFQAAKVQQSVLRLYGPQKAYDFHMRMFARRGQADGLAALDVTKAMGLDAAKIEESADGDVVSSVLKRQTHLASSLGLAMTPSFVIGGAAFLGWPGAGAMRSLVVSVHKCGLPVCEKN